MYNHHVDEFLLDSDKYLTYYYQGLSILI
jgi:hypothetical protein